MEASKSYPKMTVKALRKSVLNEGTQDKLELYREYLREWLPVFINGSSVDIIQIFDFFAGPGFDMDGNRGSPVITCDEIRNARKILRTPFTS